MSTKLLSFFALSSVQATHCIKVSGIGLVVIYVSLCAALRLGQTRIIFFPSQLIKSTPADLNLAFEAVDLPMANGQLHGWWLPTQALPKGTLLYLHGNSSNVGDCVGRVARLQQLGFSILLIDYRGYGESLGPFPNEARVYEDAETAWQYLTLTRQLSPQTIWVYGQSLGGAIAIELASQHPDLAGVIVEGTFTSIQEMATYQWPMLQWLPLNWLMTQHFDSITKIRTLQPPILIIHGTADTTVPARMSQELYAAAVASKHLLLVPQGEHNNTPAIGQDQYLKAIQSFVSQTHD